MRRGTCVVPSVLPELLALPAAGVRAGAEPDAAVRPPGVMRSLGAEIMRRWISRRTELRCSFKGAPKPWCLLKPFTIF